MAGRLKAARRVLRKAQALCRRDAGGCFPHHALRPYLRLFGMVGGPGRNAAFFHDSLAAVARERANPPRILISGTADDSMFVLVHGAVPDAVATVLDRCELPLHLCRDRAQREGASVTTIPCDIFGYAPQGDFDVVCCDAFFCQIPNARHAGLVDVWRQALQPGGRVITATRIDPDSPDEGRVRSPAQIAAFRDRVVENARPWRRWLGMTLAQIADLAERHARQVRLHNPRSRDELAGLFESGGFRIDRIGLDEQARPARADSERDRVAVYAEVIATRL